MRTSTILVVIGLVCLTGCAPRVEKHIAPVASLTPHITLHGVVVVPPPGGDWTETIGDDDISYGKMDPISKTHSFIAAAVVLGSRTHFETPNDFLAFMRDRKTYIQEPERYINMQVECALDNRYGRYCVKYHMIFEDHGAKNRGDADFLMIEASGYIMLNPHDETIAIDISYSDRYVPGEENAEWRKQGEAFLASLSFQPIKDERRPTSGCSVRRTNGRGYAYGSP